jgi:sugar lactone lactonase YvrE
VTLLGPSSRGVSEKLGGWITGLAAAADGSVYVACSSAVLKVTPLGTVTTLVDTTALQRLNTDTPGTARDGEKPSLRGLAADSRGTVYAADTGRRRVVKITPDAKVETVLKTERPWSPTGVTVHGQYIYVLEYANADEDYAEWLPRVRQLGHDGTITLLASVSKGDRQRRR